ncbi:unnamed protein product [Rotaria magnacalcarata]|uniref:Uncharacterized protein n=1 Tax=Rotaria magnacalcarata TaxID=392030 RepID=A0A816SKE1_9BILA|nr:unnamed protein product [Rotaria magnacalcarata]
MAFVKNDEVLPVENVAEYLGEHHGQHILHACRSVQKYYVRLESIKRDLRFLKACQSNDIIPKFLWTSNVFELSLDTLCELISYRVFEHLHRMVILFAARLLEEKENTLKNKLWNLGVGDEYFESNDPEVVTNLSSRVISDEEVQCLTNGLDYGLIPEHIDRLNVASNVEQFYHRVTDIAQHHKKCMNELMEHGTIVKTDVRVLASKELTFTSDLRSLTQSFLHKVDQFREQNIKIKSKEQNYCNILKKLRGDNSIIITRPDKGR